MWLILLGRAELDSATIGETLGLILEYEVDIAGARQQLTRRTSAAAS